MWKLGRKDVVTPGIRPFLEDLDKVEAGTLKIGKLKTNTIEGVYDK